MKGKRGVITALSDNFFLIKYVFRFTPVFAVFKTVMQPVNAFISVFTYTYSLKFILDSIQEQKGFQYIMTFLAFLALANVVIRVIDAYLEHVSTPIAREKLKKELQLELFDKAMRMDLSCYDDPEFYNQFILSISQAEEKSFLVFENVMELISQACFVLSLGAVILTMDIGGLIFALAATALSLLGNIKITKLKYEKDIRSKPYERKRDYVKRVFYLADYAKEIRLYDVKGKLISEFTDSNRMIKSYIKRYFKRIAPLTFLNKYILNSLLVFCVYMIVLLYKTLVLKTISLGSFATMFYATSQLKDYLLLFTAVFPKLQSNSLYIECFKKFIEYRPKILDLPSPHPVRPQPHELCLKDIRFCYETGGRPVLQGINLKITPGSKIALVGYNGAGKSTLVKLLLRLYETEQGEILLDGRNIKEYGLQAYRDLFGVVFQDYQIFAATLAQNVTMKPGKLDSAQRARVWSALRISGLEPLVAKLPQGIDTPLTKEFEEHGVNLSGGEKQKLALARVLYKDSPFVVLDEPSSALDPLSEFHFNQVVMQQFQNKTVIFISHRLSTTKMADRIYLLKNGAVLEEGSHDQLMQQNGVYKAMFEIQASKYKTE